MVDVNKKKKTKKKKKKKKEEEEETGGEGRKEHVDDVRKRHMFTLVSWLLLACLLLGKTHFNGSEVLGKTKVV